MIEIKDLTVKYGAVTAVDHVSVRIPSQTSIAVVGESGSGKSTLLYAIADLIETTSGTVCYHGEPMNRKVHKISVVLQSYGLFAWKTVLENIILPLKLHHQDMSDVDEMLAFFNIEHLRDRYPSQLSGGEKQRVALARAAIVQPELLLLDEATSALDFIAKERIQDMIKSFQKQQALTTVVVTHNIEEAVYLGRYILIMKEGKLQDVISNESYEKKVSRDELEFVEMCQKVRKALLCES